MMDLGAILAQEPDKTPKGEEMGLQGSPWDPILEAKLDSKRTKLEPNGFQVNDFVGLCLHLCNHVCQQAQQSPIQGPLDFKMLARRAQHARAEGHEMRALLIRNTLFQLRCPVALGSVVTPHLGPIFPQVGPKLAPRGGLGGLLDSLGMDLEEVLGSPGKFLRPDGLKMW